MDYEMRPCEKSEVGDLLRTCMTAFSGEAKDEEVEVRARIVEPERTLAVFDEGEMVATAAAFSFTLTIPETEVPAAGVTLVGVLPSHRRKGILTAMMKRQLEDCRELGEPVAILWASEGAIYPKFGYGLAGYHAFMEIDRDKALFKDPSPPAGRSRILSYDEALKVIPDVYERVRVQTPGMFARSQTWWEAHRLYDPEHDREGAGPMLKAVVEIDGRAEAYCLYRVKQEWTESGMPDSTLFVEEAMGTTAEATKAIWAFLFGVDLIARLKYYFVAVDAPLRFMLRAQRPMQFKLADALWLRIVDVKKALEARSYAIEETLVLDLRDPFCSWNEGVWELRVSQDGATVTETDALPDLRLTAQELGSVYLGGVRFAELERAGDISELKEGAVRKADLMFYTETGPWTPEIF